jgi:hypothetical protein
MDELERAQLEKMKGQLNVGMDKPVPRTGGCPSLQRQVNWACAWSASTKARTATPAQLLHLSRDELNVADPAAVWQNYADSWALVHLFGTTMLGELAQPSDTIPQVARRLPLLSTPWAQVKNLVKTNRDLQRRLALNLEECQATGSQDARE